MKFLGFPRVHLALGLLIHVTLYAAVWRLCGGIFPPDWLIVALACILIWISLNDFATREIPDLASLALLGLGIAHLFRLGWPLALDGLAGGVFWPLTFWAISEGYLKLRGQDGLGFGDVKLMAGIGVLAGLSGGAFVVGTAAVAGVATILVRRILREQDESTLALEAVAFGPFLCLSLWAHLMVRGLE